MSALGTYLLYYFIIVSSSIIAWLSKFFKKVNVKKLPKWVFFSAIIIPITVSGLRYGIGTDYEAYVNMYYNITSYPGISSAISETRYEPGWIILNYIVKYIFDDVAYVFIVAALFTWLFSFKAIYDNKEHISIGIAVIILLCTMYNMSFNIVRQVLAVSIIMLSIKPMLNKRFWKHILTVLIASTFHFTALLFLPAYWVINSKTGNRGLIKRIIIPLLFIGLVVFFKPLFDILTNIGIFSSYSNYDLDSGAFSRSTFLFKLPIILLILINAKKLKLRDNPMHKLNILFYIGVILLLLSSYSPYLDRLSYFFDITQVFIVSAIIKAQTDKYEKFLYTYGIIIYYLFWFTYFYLIQGNAGTVPYQFL